MQRREVLRRGSIVAATTLATGLAGCSGDGDTGDDGEGDDGDNDATPTPSGPTGEVVENTVEGIDIADWSTRTDEESFLITLTVENTGDQSTEAFEYTYDATIYDSADEDITSSVASGAAGDSTVAPGETTEVTLYISVEGNDPSAVERFELRVRCDDFFDEGVYCGNQ